MARVKVPIPVEKPEVAAAPAAPIVATAPQPVQSLSGGLTGQGSRRFSSQQLIVAGFGLVLIVLLVIVVNLTQDRNHLAGQVSKLSTTTNSADANKQKLTQLVDQIGQTYMLPAGETPTLATVTDIAKVQGQPFFKNAQNGDNVLLYSKAGLAILYRPSIKKIITVSAVDLSNSTPGSSTSNVSGTTPAPAP